jgi:tRNA dimethylallyltransferase
MVVAIFGATATGKSALALALARRVPCEIVSVDAMQVYEGVEILTNQPGADERAEVPHHLVGYLPLAETSSVGAHAPLAQAAVDAAAGRGALPLVVGGTGLYLRAALADLDLPPAVDATERARWERMYDERARRCVRRARRATARGGAPARQRPARRARSSCPSGRVWRPSATGCGRAACACPRSWRRVVAPRGPAARIRMRTEACSPAEPSTRRALRDAGWSLRHGCADPRARADRRLPARRSVARGRRGRDHAAHGPVRAPTGDLGA